jgi:hypothetical protein
MPFSFLLTLYILELQPQPDDEMLYLSMPTFGGDSAACKGLHSSHMLSDTPTRNNVRAVQGCHAAQSFYPGRVRSHSTSLPSGRALSSDQYKP